MQSAYIGKLMELAEKDSRIMHILADSGTGYDEMFRKNFPGQMVNFGIAEENMVAAAAGLATTGMIPFVYTAGAFLAYRAIEFIRDDVCFQNLNVKIVGMGAGLSWSSLGPTHHTTEDLAMLRAIPNLMILSPATPMQVAAAVQTAYEHDGPVYIKIGMNREREFYEDGYSLDTKAVETVFQSEGAGQTECAGQAENVGQLETIGWAENAGQAGQVVVLVTGSILADAYDACKRLADEGMSVKLVNVACIKPIPENAIKEVLAEVTNNGKPADNVKAMTAGTLAKPADSKISVFTVEEHSITGGLGSMMAEILAESDFEVRFKRIGLCNEFAKGYGNHEAVRAANNLDADGIYRQIKAYMA